MKRYNEMVAQIEILKPKPFVCKKCGEIISLEENFSEIQNICNGCFETQKALKKNTCLKCEKGKPEEKYWGLCVDCFWGNDLDGKKGAQKNE